MAHCWRRSGETLDLDSWAVSSWVGWGQLRGTGETRRVNRQFDLTQVGSHSLPVSGSTPSHAIRNLSSHSSSFCNGPGWEAESGMTFVRGGMPDRVRWG